MITFAPTPIPVMTPLGGGYVVYVVHNGMFDNDEACIALEADGQWRHFLTSDIKSWNNSTYKIGEKK